MGEKYKLQSLGMDNEVRSVAFTNESEVTIGSGLDADVRLQQPSIEENHVLVYFDHMKVRVFGGNVFLNEEVLERESMYAFRFGDVLRINRYKFVFSLTEPGDFVDEDKVIRRPTMELSYLAEGRAKGEGAKGAEVGDGVEKTECADDRAVGSAGADAVVSIALNKVAGVHVSLAGASGDVCCVKHVIEEQKEALRQEIKESIEHVVVDTPVLPSMGKRNVRDLGEVMIEKEILDSAEKAVSEKMQGEEAGVEESLDELKQSVKDNIKEELREDLRRDFMGEVREDIRDEVKEVLCSSEMKSAIATDVMSRIEDIRESPEKEEPQEDGEEGRVSEDESKAEEKPVRPRRRASSAGVRAKEDVDESKETPSRKASVRGRKRMSEGEEEMPKKRRGAKGAEKGVAEDTPLQESPKRKKGQKKEE